jgi:hypothetical protein
MSIGKPEKKRSLERCGTDGEITVNSILEK